MGFDMFMLLKIYITTGRRYRASIANVFILIYSCCMF